MEHSIIDLIAEAEEGINDAVQGDKEYRKAAKRAFEIYGKLKETLSEEQSEDFEKFIEYETQQDCIRVKKYFKFGIKYGVRLTAECMYD